MAAYLPYLGLTVAVELALAALLCRRSHRGRDRMRLAAAVVLLNCFTHPLAFLFASESLGFGPREFWILEAAVFGAEALGYRWITAMSWGRAVGLSLSCNGATVLVSYLLAFTSP